ncbi:MAG TPA: hypothetical protein VHG33_12980 [Woeseiaceae bacterium]|nr:hypothetical protein [Woeseiaceae bacterium]
MRIFDATAPSAAVICIVVLAGRSAEAAVEVCEHPQTRSFAAAAFVYHDESSIRERDGATNQENQNLDVLVASPSNAFSLGFGHRYTILDFSGIEPQTNAHLHTSWVPLHWRVRDLRVSTAVALSASSNVMGHPQEYESETLQLLFGVVARKEISDELAIDYGLCGDHRFGEYRIYPVGGFDWRPHPDWTLELGFPKTRIAYAVTGELTSSLQVAPDGNEWHVKNRDFSAESDFIYEAIALEWIMAWEPRPELTLAVSLGRQLRNRYEMTLAGGERVSVTGEPADRVGFGVRWRF